MNNNDFENNNFIANENGKDTSETGAYSSGQSRYSANYTPPSYVPNFTVIQSGADRQGAGASSAPKKEKKTFGIMAIVISCVISVLISVTLGAFAGALAGGGTVFGLSALGGEKEEAAINIIRSDRDITVSELPGNTGHSDLSVAEVAALVGDSVVEITTSQLETNLFYGQYVTSGAGSGVIFDQNGNYGYIVTNYHVISGANKITVRVKNGDSYKEYNAEYMAGDSAGDIAVIRIEARDHQLTKAVFVSDSDKLIVGEEVVAIGNPLGELGGTVTNGIISALDREIVIEDNAMVLLQTNAAINPGNSGGGLFNMAGQLIGIVNAKISQEGIEGLGFAIPIDIAHVIIEDLIQYGYVRGLVDSGLTIIEITNRYDAYQYGFNTTGVIIVESAFTDELTYGDKITHVNGIKIGSADDLKIILKSCKVGDEVTITVERGGQAIDVKLTLAEKVPDSVSFG